MMRKKFTLLELLIVISIIMILSSILIPALSKAKELTTKIKCVNNLKQIGLTISMYGNDNNYYAPVDQMDGPSRFWQGRLTAYAGLPDNLYYDDKRLIGSIFNCPKYQQEGSWVFYSNYAPNYYITGESYLGYTYSPTPLSRIKTPALMLLLVDISEETRVSMATWNKVRYRHVRRANILFADFHVGNIPVTLNTTPMLYPVNKN